MIEDQLNPIHPGEVLQEEFIKPLGLSQNRLALAIGVPARRINEIVLGRRGITADTALRLARFFGNSPQFWLGLQTDYDLDVTRRSLGTRLARDVRSYASLREDGSEYHV
jgi:antitoxin HigA-1